MAKMSLLQTASQSLTRTGGRDGAFSCDAKMGLYHKFFRCMPLARRPTDGDAKAGGARAIRSLRAAG
ncbi:protein of unknown function [Burkholderia multivorans]